MLGTLRSRRIENGIMHAANLAWVAGLVYLLFHPLDLKDHGLVWIVAMSALHAIDAGFTDLRRERLPWAMVKGLLLMAATVAWREQVGWWVPVIAIPALAAALLVRIRAVRQDGEKRDVADAG